MSPINTSLLYANHSTVSLRLKISERKRGQGFRKFNCSLLKDHNFLESIMIVIQNIFNKYACLVYTERYLTNMQNRESIQMKINDALFLENLLVEIKSDTITYSIRREEKDKKRKLYFKWLAYAGVISTCFWLGYAKYCPQATRTTNSSGSWKWGPIC